MFANQTFKIVQRTKVSHSLITHCNIEVTHEYKVIINFAVFINHKIQVVSILVPKSCFKSLVGMSSLIYIKISPTIEFLSIDKAY